MPRPILWQDDADRYAHADLPDLPDDALELEGFRVLLRLALEPPNRKDRSAWLRERRERVAAEQARRAQERAAEEARERLPVRIEWGHAKPQEPAPRQPRRLRGSRSAPEGER